ncbi:ferritin-like domain-containing protein [Streptomyces hyderabadensis]|uniref:Ferritin-like domain-containing protein n=1 Tax=Streptomyces hyderabadensis TaxID=598549 RepID=A0ABP9IPM1_9ACTN|nr:ferritin-like domain-containing protein [Streptomyces hyderabadensis]
MSAAIDLESLTLDNGGHLLVRRALGTLRPGERLTVRGAHPELPLQLGAWARSRGHRVDHEAPAPTDGRPVTVLVKGAAEELRWSGARRAGRADRADPHADPRWGLAARGALVEEGGPALDVAWVDRDLVWADVAPTLYARAAASQWDPATAVDWAVPDALPTDIEDAVVQVMTYLVENEQAALMIPARMLANLHPHYREVMQLLASQVADEARHVEVFTRRALLHRERPGTSGAGGRASLQTLLGEPDFTLASFLLSVLGEGTFVDLLGFLHHHAPDPVTAGITRLAARDEARHVAFGVAHTAHVTRSDPAFLGRLRQAVERRHDALRDTAGLNQEVYDSLVLLAAGSWEPAAIRRGWDAVQELQRQMDDGRRRRLHAIGFPDDESAELSALHTRNFM